MLHLIASVILGILHNINEFSLRDRRDRN